MNIISKSQRGFTLIELIMAMVLIAILGAVAIPHFTDLTPDAKQSAVKGVAGALGAASASNYGQRKANSTSGAAVDNCNDAGAILTGGLPTEYSITSAAIANDATATCTVKRIDDNSIQATFVGMGIS